MSFGLHFQGPFVDNTGAPTIPDTDCQIIEYDEETPFHGGLAPDSVTTSLLVWNYGVDGFGMGTFG